MPALTGKAHFCERRTSASTWGKGLPMELGCLEPGDAIHTRLEALEEFQQNLPDHTLLALRSNTAELMCMCFVSQGDGASIYGKFKFLTSNKTFLIAALDKHSGGLQTRRSQDTRSANQINCVFTPLTRTIGTLSSEDRYESDRHGQ
jgi:hypothetical protein